MKKRLLSALLALALVFVLLPTTALAGETTGKDYDISINGKGYKFDSDGSSGYITAYYYGNSPSNYFFSTEANDNWATNSNLKLTKEGNTVTITIRPKKRHISGNTIEFTLEKKSTTSGSPYDYTPCIEMGNNNNLVITGKGTLNITRDEKNGIGAALCSEVGDITITDGITVKANFLKQVSESTTGNAISIKDHNLIISGKNTKVEARNSSCNFQDLYYVSATVCVENGEIKVSDGATLDAANSYTNPAGSRYSYYSRAISGSNNNPCTLTVTGENSCVIAETDNSLGKAYGHVNFSIDGAKIEVGTSSPAQTITDINNIKNYKYAKISVPALQRTSDVFIAGEKAVVGQWTTITADSCSGSYYYDADKKELTLKDVNITRNNNNVNHAIQFTKNGDYTINLEGANNISSVTNGICALNKAFYDNPANISVTITGTGSLNVIANTYAIDMQVGNLIFNNTGNITLTTNTNYKVPSTVCNALRVKPGSITIDNTKYDIVGARQEKGYPTETISDSSAFTPDLLNGYTVGEETTLFKTITITPAAAKDSTIRYNGTTLKQGETIKDGKGGTATVDRENNTITLKNFNGTALSFDATLADSTLVLEGTNTLSSIVTTQKGLTISGSGSLTVGSIRVTNNYNIHADLTITDGATVIAGTTTSDAKAIDITGNLTVNSGATLTATNTSETNPTIDVTGNVTISGNGTNEYTVSAHNSYNVQKDRDGHLSASGVPSAIKIGGTLKISAGARVMAQTDSYGAGVMLGLNSTITVADAFLSAKNSSCDFAAISFSGHMGDIYVSGAKGEIVAENTHTNIGQSLAHKAINAFVYNRNTDFNLKMQSEGVKEEAKNKIIAPGKHDASGGYKVTITRGSAYTAPTESPVVIAGTTLLNDTYYTITDGSTVAVGTDESNYNAFYDSTTKTLKLNNAVISHSFAHEDGGGTDGAIIFKEYKNYCIELSGTNTISSMNTYAINGDTNSLTIKNAAGTENAKLTLTGNWTAICSTEGLNIQSDVTMVNTKRADHLMYVNGTFSFDGYNAYASVNASGSPLVEYTVPTSGEKDAGYQYLRITKETLETGGGSTHQHTYDQSAWKSDATHHWQECTDPNCPDPTKGITNKASHIFSNGACTVCGYRGQTEEHHFGTEWFSNAEYHWHKCTDEGCDAISGKAPHEWTGWLVNDYRPEVHAQRCNCGYLGSTHSTLKYVAIDGNYHQKQCPVDGCGYKIESSTTSHVYEEGSNICTECGYDRSAPCDHTDRIYTNNGDGTHKVTCKACGATLFEKQNHEFDPTTGACVCGATQSGGNPTPDNPGTIVIIRPAEEEKPAQQPNPSTGANDLVGLAVAAAVAAALGSAALLRKHD